MFSVTLSILLVLPTRRCQATNWTATMAEAANKTIWEAARLPVLFMTEIFFLSGGTSYSSCQSLDIVCPSMCSTFLPLKPCAGAARSIGLGVAGAAGDFAGDGAGAG